MDYFSADFETTTLIDDCRVWAWGICDIYNIADYHCGTSIDTFIEHISGLTSPVVYFHNLKFDGEYILSYLLNHGYKHIKDRRERETKTFVSLISEQNAFYAIEVFTYVKGKEVNSIRFYDSNKLITCKVEDMPKAFNLPLKKLDIDYQEFRPIGHILTEQEHSYLRNDVTIVALALRKMFDNELTSMTIGACALKDFKSRHSRSDFERYFPTPDFETDYEIRQSYKGGYTYVSKLYKGKDIGDGIVLDVNSLYPWVMRYKQLPYGKGIYYSGEYKENILYPLYVHMFKCSFQLRENMLPTIQIKGTNRFTGNEYLESSNDEIVTLCLTSVDYQLFLDHYHVYELEHIGGYMFKSTDKLFVAYVDYWVEQKTIAKEEGNVVLYTIAKLMLNSLYGKFSTNPVGRSKIPYLNNGIVNYQLGEKEERSYLYIPVGTFITSYAREKTIRTAQENYFRFIYADTDSLHLTGLELPNVEISETILGAWKHEFTFSKARYLRQKCYIEFGNDPNKLLKREEPFWKITVSGMPKACYEHVTWENFHIGSSYEGKLKPVHTIGGIVLQDTPFTIKKGV